jgi:glycosyltransferase involved in cell wall biosynthesis
VIVSRNRADDLARAVDSALRQRGDNEVLVMDDGSTDRTPELGADYGDRVAWHRSETSHGYIVQRNRAAALARGELLVSIDDDAEFSTDDIVVANAALFEDPRVGAMTIPWDDVGSGAGARDCSPDERTWITSSFTGRAYAVRRQLFLGLGGFREAYRHFGEEADFCLRVLDAGYLVRLGQGAIVEHRRNPNRDQRREVFMQRRNAVLFAWFNAPAAALPAHLAYVAVRAPSVGFRAGSVGAAMRGLAAGYRACAMERATRSAVSLSTYRLARRLQRHGPIPVPPEWTPSRPAPPRRAWSAPTIEP